MRGAARILVCAWLVGCGSDRVAEIHAEIEKLRAERVDASLVSAARSEADAAEQHLAATQAAVAEQQAEGKRLADQKLQLLATVAREAELTEHVRSEIAETQQATALEVAETEKKEGEIVQARSRALAVREQAAVLARELRPGDPPWATERRVKSVREFLAKVSREYPDDPVVADLARSGEESATEGSADAGALAAEKAARLRDRFTRVYGLDAPEVAAGERAPVEAK